MSLSNPGNVVQKLCQIVGYWFAVKIGFVRNAELFAL